MRGITKFVFTSARTIGVSALVVAAVAAGILAAGCSRAPASPTAPAAHPTGTAAATAQGTSQSWQDFQAHGWNCRTPGGGPVTVCSPPGQPLPTPAFPPDEPPDDRPPTVMLKRWRDGVFEANVLLIRPELYNGQLCEPTDEPYVWAAVLGYFECAHPAEK